MNGKVETERIFKFHVRFTYHESDGVLYSGESWCIRSRTYIYEQPRETAKQFLAFVEGAALNRWCEHMQDQYWVHVDKTKVKVSSKAVHEYESKKELNKEERKQFNNVEYTLGSVTKKWVEQEVLRPKQLASVV